MCFTLDLEGRNQDRSDVVAVALATLCHSTTVARGCSPQALLAEREHAAQPRSLLMPDDPVAPLIAPTTTLL